MSIPAGGLDRLTKQKACREGKLWDCCVQGSAVFLPISWVYYSHCVCVVLRLGPVTTARRLGLHVLYGVRKTVKPHHQPWNLLVPCSLMDPLRRHAQLG